MTHLSSTQISEWTLGESNSDVDRHLQTCTTCHEEVLRFRDGLVAFKRSVHSLAEQMDHTETQMVFVPRAAVSWRWAAASAMAISLALLPLYLDHAQRRQEAQNAQDSLLLTQVNARLAESVPQPMKQLMELMNDKEGAAK